MKVIATQSGPFAFAGIHVVQVNKGDEFEGTRAKQLLNRGWAVDANDEEAILKAAQENADAKAAEEADALALIEQQGKISDAEKKVADLQEAADKAAAELAEDADNSSLKGKVTKANKALAKAQDELEALKAE